jgi:indole-3-glycerol phosphate synthase
VQASSAWAPPAGTLGQILDATRLRLASLDREPDAGAGDNGKALPEPPSLRSALRRHTVTVIAEIKRKSPSKGDLRPTMRAASRAAAYERGGASAISVLTESEFFGGSIQDLVDAARAVEVPVLRKDFHIDVRQLLHARQAGAAAVLLIARALPQRDLKLLAEAARDLKLETVIEVRTDDELQRALDAGTKIVGVNSRDLETLAVDESVPERLMPKIPEDIIGIWESGVHDVDGVKRAAAAGADAVLVGSALSATEQYERLVRSFCGVPRQGRHG